MFVKALNSYFEANYFGSDSQDCKLNFVDIKLFFGEE
jgi:hypothetical protein